MTRHTRGSCLLLLAKTESICLCLNMTRERKESTHKPPPSVEDYAESAAAAAADCV